MLRPAFPKEDPMSVDKFSAIFDGLKQAYGTYKVEKLSPTVKILARLVSLRNRGPRNSGKVTCPAKAPL